MEEFPSNSHKSKEASTEKRVEKIVVGEVTIRKPPLGRRLANTFFGGDARGVVGYVLADVLLPAAKDMVADAISQGIEQLLFGQTRSSSRRSAFRSTTPGTSYINYNRISSPTSRPTPRDEPRDISRRARSADNVDEITLETRAEGEGVIDALEELIRKYESASVSDLYSILGVTGEFTDERYGWTDLRNARVSRSHGGYRLELPRPELLK